MNESVASNHTKVIGVVTIILGVMALATPLLAGESILVLIGIFIAAAGALRMIWTFTKGSPGSGI